MRPVPDDIKARFRILLRAASDKRLFVATCPELQTGRPAFLVCEAIPILGSRNVDLLPVAELISEYPYNRYGSPRPDCDGITVALRELRGFGAT